MTTLFDVCTCGDTARLYTVHRDDGQPCFAWEPPDANRLGHFQAHSATTSRRAALDVYPRSGTQRATVLGYLITHIVGGATDDEISYALGMNPSSVRPRRIELVEGGWVRARLDGGGDPVERPTRSKSMAQVWEATMAARRGAWTP
jgi:hypothetical protein